jgi:NAD(P)-dependent dehydrogenase (short-subunit alcohol dehydrogenase family)
MNVIVTGASRGIGLETIQQFLSKGDTVFCLTRNTEALKSVSSDRLYVHATDLSSEDSMNQAIAFI